MKVQQLTIWTSEINTKKAALLLMYRGLGDIQLVQTARNFVIVEGAVEILAKIRTA